MKSEALIETNCSCNNGYIAQAVPIPSPKDPTSGYTKKKVVTTL